MALYDEFNREIPDPTPVAVPVGYKAPETLAETIQRMVNNNEYLKAWEGAESIEEADDFECDDDDVMMASPHEYTELQEEYVATREEPQNTPEPPKETQPSSSIETPKAEPSPSANPAQ